MGLLTERGVFVPKKKSEPKPKKERKPIAPPLREDLLVDVPRGVSSRVVARYVEWDDGRTGVDVRRFVSTDRYDGPTRQGVFLTLDEFRQAATVLEDLLSVDLAI